MDGRETRIELVLRAYRDGGAVPAERARVRRAMTGARGNTMQDYWQKHFAGHVFETGLTDGGRMQLRLPVDEPLVDRLEITVETLTPDACDFLFKIATEGGVAIDGIRPGPPRFPSGAIVFDEEQRAHVHREGGPDVSMAGTARELATLLGMSDADWEMLRAPRPGGERPEPATTEALKAFIDAAAGALPPTHVRRLRNEAIVLSHRIHTTDAIHEAFATLDTSKRTVFLAVDVRDDDEIVRQGNAMARTRGVKDEFSWSRASSDDGSQTAQALLAYDEWLAERGFRFVHWNLNEVGPPDDFRGFVIPTAEVEAFLEKARQAGLRCYVGRCDE